jgi:hypothetical protein
MFSYSLDSRGGQVRLGLTGEAAFTAHRELDAALAAALALGPRSVTVDVGRLEFIDSHAVGTVVKPATPRPSPAAGSW